jgi:hypothetical protein
MRNIHRRLRAQVMVRAGSGDWRAGTGTAARLDCPLHAAIKEGGIRFAIPPYELVRNPYSAASLALLFLAFRAFSSTGFKNSPV